MNWLSKKLFYSIGISLLCCGLQAQSLDQAKKLYNEGEYAEAKPAFERLVKQSPGNSSYNHWYGVCCYETGDLEGAEKHLKIAVKRNIQDSYRYLANVYYKTYRFEEAAEMMEKYISLLAKKKQDTQLFDIQLDLANNARRMMEKVEDIQIIDSTVVDKDQFLAAYMLSEENGSLSTYKNFFQTAEPVNSVVYMNQKRDKIYYAHPTEEDRYCLFTQSMLMDKWGDEKQLPMNINSTEDDNYPFVLSDGVTIYYASKGNNSLGGYDLFVTRYNINSDSYLAPEQLGMPFNSPYNDYMIVFDEVKGLGWFVSDRFQPEGKACVYLFIPNPQHTRIENEDIDIKRARAAIYSIADSWKEGSDYSELIRLAHTEIPYGEEKIEKDFDFIIGNNIAYYKWEEIKSPEAKRYYEKVMALHGQINELKEKLTTLRASYSAGNAAKREQLKPTILQIEEQLNGLLNQPAEWEKKARNAEINYLKKLTRDQ